MKTTCIYFCRRWYFCLIFTITLVDLSILAGGIRTATDQWVLKSIIVDTMFCNFGKYSFHSPQIKCIKHAVYKLPHEGRNDLTQITLGLGANLTFPPAFIYQYNPIQSLNNLFSVGWKLKNADIICYMLTLLVSFQQWNVEKSEKSVKVVNTEGENINIFWKYSGKMQLMIILKFTKKWLSLSRKTHFWKMHRSDGGWGAGGGGGGVGVGGEDAVW